MSDEGTATEQEQFAQGEDINQQSAVWPGGAVQETPSWCFAATEQILQAAFGNQVSQESIAHTVMMAQGAAGANDTAVNYATAITEIVSSYELPNSDYDTVQAYLDDSHHTTLQNNWGDLPLTGRTFATGGALSMDDIVNTIDGGGLVAYGNAVHWKIIYGYTRTAAGEDYLWVYDPMTGSETMPDYATVAGSMQISHRVTG